MGFEKVMGKKNASIILLLLFVASCHKALTKQNMEISLLTQQFIYGPDTAVRIKALKALTKFGIDIRINAMDDFIDASSRKIGLFPKIKLDDSDKKQTLLNEIICADFINNHSARNAKEYYSIRKKHLQILNRMILLSIKHKMYYETAELCYQRYVCGTLWLRESQQLGTPDKEAAFYFMTAGNSGSAYLQYLSEIVTDTRTKELIGKHLDNKIIGK